MDKKQTQELLNRIGEKFDALEDKKEIIQFIFDETKDHFEFTDDYLTYQQMYDKYDGRPEYQIDIVINALKGILVDWNILDRTLNNLFQLSNRLTWGCCNE